MKNLHRLSLFSLALSVGLASATWAGAMPTMQIKISKSSGKTVYEGATNSAGTFHTPELAPGSYVVQFNAKSAPAGGPFSLVIEDTGKGSSVANSVSGGRFARGGVAMKVEVGPKAMSLSGHVSPAGSAKAAVVGSTSKQKNGVFTENGKKVKYEDGKKFIWVEGISAMGGHWALADSNEAKNATNTVGKQAPAGDHESDR